MNIPSTENSTKNTKYLEFCYVRKLQIDLYSWSTKSIQNEAAEVGRAELHKALYSIEKVKQFIDNGKGPEGSKQECDLVQMVF